MIHESNKIKVYTKACGNPPDDGWLDDHDTIGTVEDAKKSE